MTEKKIITVEVDPASPITKGIGMRGKAFFKAVVLVCADGQRINSHLDSERKKDLPGRIEREQRAAAAGCLSASFSESGEFYGTMSKWKIGAGGLVPDGSLEEVSL